MTTLYVPECRTKLQEVMDRFEYKTILDTQIPNKRINFLNAMGRDGWELIQTEKLYFLFIVVDARHYFKRKL
jgi:hypothetical protein